MNNTGVAFLGMVFFTALLAINWLRTRHVLDPNVTIFAIWSFTFGLITILGDKLVGVSATALLIFVLGLVFFSIGAELGKAIPVRMRTEKAYDTRGDRLILWIFFLSLLLGMPFYLAAIRQFSSAAFLSPTFFLEVRLGMLSQSANGARVPPVYNLVTLSSIAAMLAFALTDSGRRSRILNASIVILALIYNLLTASKAGAFNLAIMLLAIYASQRGRMPTAALLSAFLLVVFLFGLVTVQRAASNGFEITSISASINTTFEEISNYLCSGPVGFSVYLENPQLVQPVWSPWRFFERTANYFGDYFIIPDLNAAFVNIGGGKYYNTYTAFFSYFPPYGLFGVVVFMFGLGVISGAAYRRARQKHLVWTLLYASIYAGIIMTIFNESLLLALNPILKLIAVSGTVNFLKRVRFIVRDDSRRIVALPK